MTTVIAWLASAAVVVVLGFLVRRHDFERATLLRSIDLEREAKRDWEKRYLELDARYRQTVDSQAATLLAVSQQMGNWRNPGPVEPARMVRQPGVEELAAERARDQAHQRTKEGLRLRFQEQGKAIDEQELDELAGQLLGNYRDGFAETP